MAKKKPAAKKPAAKTKPARATTAAPAKPKPKPKAPAKPNPKPIKAPPKNGNHYEYITAVVEAGHLSVRYKLNNAVLEGHHDHEEDVSDWSRAELLTLIRAALDVEADDPVDINLTY